jgi:protein-disulfide isomerase
MSTVEDDEQDLTRKQRREQAREQRRALEEAEAASAQRRRRLIQLGSVIGVVVVIVIVIVAATSGGGSKGGIQKSTGAGKTPPAVREASALLGGIPQSGLTLGHPNAPVTMQYFGDLECPVCKDFTLGALSKLIEKDVRAGKLRIEYRNLETATTEPETFRTQQIAALAAGKQGKGWDYIELFYHEQGGVGTGYVTVKYLQELAQQVPGLNLATWTSDRGSPQFTNVVTSDAQAANNAGFTGTPSFLIGKTGQAGHKYEYSSLTDPAGFEAAIASALKE